MPVAVGMNAGMAPLTSPTSPRMTKAAFFRARSPPITSIGDGNDLASRFDALQASIDPFTDGRYTPDSSSESHGRNAPVGNGRSTLGPSPPRAPASSYRSHSTDQTSPPSANSLSTGHSYNRPTNGSAPMQPRRGMSIRSSEDDEYGDGMERSTSGSESRAETIPTSDIAGGSDEMLMTLLAGQAAVDCEGFQVGAWETVDGWKKELSFLSNRLDSLVARHQREVKILMAARTLQKLNNANKRMSKQTFESLEQAEKRAEAAEKEVLVLRDREAVLRRQLTEHWAGVMAWEMRRLAQTSAQTEEKYKRQSVVLTKNKAREDDLTRLLATMEADVVRKDGRSEELEVMVAEMGKRERALEDELRLLEDIKAQAEMQNAGWDEERESWNRERDAWEQSRSMLDRDRDGWEDERRGFEEERQGWQMEKRILQQEREASIKDKQARRESGMMLERDKVVMDRVRTSLAVMLGRKGGVGQAEVIDAVEELKRLLEKREDEVMTLKEEMREVNMGLEEELRRTQAERDTWKTKSDKTGSASRDEISALERRMKAQSNQISDLSLRNESLATSLAAAQESVSTMSTSTGTSRALQSKIDSLEHELESIAGQFNEVWSLLPSKARRAEAELVDPRTGMSNSGLISPSRSVNFAALQQVYKPNGESFAGIDEMLRRVRGMADDGKLLIERVCKLGAERETLKASASRSRQVADSTQKGMEGLKQLVSELEAKLANNGDAESRYKGELDSLRSALEAASTQKRRLELQASTSADDIQRLTQANNTLSAQTLSLAEDAEGDKKAMQQKLHDEIESLRKQLEDAQEEIDEARTRGSAQRIQLLDELNDLQAENADLRKQIRARK